jgi:molecular chaperone GrpE
MTTSKRRIPINNHEPAAGDGLAATGVTETGSPTDEPRAQEAPVTDAPLAQAGTLDDLVRERDNLADSLLRLRAEFENFRKRAARELVEARDRARGELLGELLPVLDNLERALDAAEHHDEGKVLGGVRLTRDLFVELLRRSGVEEIETVGTPFDPHVHDAMLEQASDQKEGMVAAVLERGYRQGDRVLRPARVAVSSGPGRAGHPRTSG